VLKFSVLKVFVYQLFISIKLLKKVMKRIVLSLSMVAAIAVVVVGATSAFFSDTETSTGNTFAAGAIDLQIDNESYATDPLTGNLALSTTTSWTLRDLTLEKFFNFSDVKPGDMGEDTISLHVNNNDSWLCADVSLTSNNDNTCTEPEGTDEGGNCGTDPGAGELANHINFIWWADDGDNVLEDDENVLPGGPLGAIPVGATSTVALADSVTNIWGPQGPLAGGSVRFIGKAWCFGDITPIPVQQDGSGNTGTNGPLSSRGPGVGCSGASGLNNVTQTDSLTADVAFRAVQSRNNAGFTCQQP